LQIVIAVFCVSINLLGLILSDSIASFILLIFYLTFYALFSLIHRGYMDRSKAKNAFLFSCVFLAVSFIVTHIILQGGLQSNISSLVNCFFDKFDKNINFKFGRSEYDLKYGSGRKILIDQALIIFKNNPIWGIGISNIEKFGNLYFDTGIAFPNYILGIAFPNFHNGYLTILACYGLLGFLVFLLFFIKVFATFFAGFLKKAMELNFQDIAVYKCLLAFLCSYLIFALFEKTFLSEINFMGITFWVILGYLMNLFHHLKNEGRSNI
ncbi:MAG: O-antigen ligase family protein, partial [Clostridia bacterium]|nr:O-antigen ligase family protein [Clostridia bacterium]